MIWGFLILFSMYFLCLLILVCGFKKVNLFSSEEIMAKTGFTVIIPFRNEAENLPALLKTIENLEYSKELFEIIFVNDSSEDHSEIIISAALQKSIFSIKMIQNQRISNSPKKDAISEAIKKASFDWIVTTDADCKLPESWLQILDSFIQFNNPIMVCGPVNYESKNRLIENFQKLDNLSLQTVSMGTFGFQNQILCNGANLAYKKSAFLKMDGFSGNDHIASGDDIFLLEKMKKENPGNVLFLKSKQFIVSTKPQKTWKDAISQRIRWVSKTSEQENQLSLFLGGLVFTANVSLLAIFIFMIFHSENLLPYFLLLLFKISADYIFIRGAAAFFDEKISFWKFPLQTCIYAAVILIVVLGSFSGNYMWKGRNMKMK